MKFLQTQRKLLKLIKQIFQFRDVYESGLANSKLFNERLISLVYGPRMERVWIQKQKKVKISKVSNTELNVIITVNIKMSWVRTKFAIFSN